MGRQDAVELRTMRRICATVRIGWRDWERKQGGVITGELDGKVGIVTDAGRFRLCVQRRRRPDDGVSVVTEKFWLIRSKLAKSQRMP